MITGINFYITYQHHRRLSFCLVPYLYNIEVNIAVCRGQIVLGIHHIFKAVSRGCFRGSHTLLGIGGGGPATGTWIKTLEGSHQANVVRDEKVCNKPLQVYSPQRQQSKKCCEYSLFLMKSGFEGGVFLNVLSQDRGSGFVGHLLVAYDSRFV